MSVMMMGNNCRRKRQEGDKGGGKSRGTIWLCASCPSFFLSTTNNYKITSKD